MATTTRVWISPQAHERLHRELDTLRFLFSAGIADADTDENASRRPTRMGGTDSADS